MNNNTRKIVVLNNLNSPRIEQAIFILRDEVEISGIDALGEAQKIVDRYIKSLESPSPERTKRKPRAKFLLGLALYTFVTIIMTVYLSALR